MTALSNWQPDRIPATPDISIMIPCKLTGKPNYEIEVNNNPSLTSAYIRAARYFGMDGWLFNGTLSFKMKSQVTREITIDKQVDRWNVRTVIHTPDGDMTSVSVHPFNNPGTMLGKPIKHFKEDFRKVQHLFSEILSYDDTLYRM